MGPFQSGLLNNLQLWSNEQSAKFEEFKSTIALQLYNAVEAAVSTFAQIIDSNYSDGSRSLKSSGKTLKSLSPGSRDDGPTGRGIRVRNKGEYMKEVVKRTEQRPIGVKVAVDLPKAVAEVGGEVR